MVDLLLQKLARINFKQKDIQDSAALLVDHRVTDGGDEEEEINRERLYHVVNTTIVSGKLSLTTPSRSKKRSTTISSPKKPS